MKKKHHSQLKYDLAKFLYEKRLSDHFFIFNRVVGKIYFKRGKSYFGPYKAGEAGQCDLYILGCGSCIEIELKGEGDRLREDQLKWKRFCFKKGIPHHIIRSETKEKDLNKLHETLTRIFKEWMTI